MSGPQTFRDAASVVVDDMLKSDAKYQLGWYRGYSAAAALLGLDTSVEPEPLPEWAEQFFTRQVSELKRLRSTYATPAKSPQQIAAEARWSWRQAERSEAS